MFIFAGYWHNDPPVTCPPIAFCKLADMPRRSNRGAADVAAVAATSHDWDILVASAQNSDTIFHVKVVCLEEDLVDQTYLDFYVFSVDGAPCGATTFTMDDGMAYLFEAFDRTHDMHKVYEAVFEAVEDNSQPHFIEGIILAVKDVNPQAVTATTMARLLAPEP